MNADPERTLELLVPPSAHPPKGSAPPPKKIARYDVAFRIGEGGFGEVFSAFDPDLKRHVAIKLIRGLRALPPQEAHGFQQEARVLASLDHPGIVPIYDFGFHEGSPFIVMKLVEGKSLAGVFAGGEGLEEAEVLRVAVQATEALAYAHRNGVLHRDIKPHNLMIGRDGKVTMLDFGLALMLRELCKEKLSIMGTPGFMPPEVESAGLYSMQSDLYSLGVSLHWLLTGALPASAPGGSEMAADDEAESKAESSLLDRLLRRLLEKEPGRRPKSTDEVLTLLKNLATLADSFGDGFGQAKIRALPSGELLGLLTEEFLRACECLKSKLTGEQAGSDAISADFVAMVEKGRALLRPAGATARLRPEDRLCRTALENAHAMAAEFEPELRRLGIEGKVPPRFADGLIAELRATITKPAKKLLWLVEQIGGELDSSGAGDFEEAGGGPIEFAECGLGRSSWREKLLSSSELDRYEALLAIVGAEQPEFLTTLPFLAGPERHQVLAALWSQADLLLLEGREKARAVFEAACANAEEPSLRDHWIKLFSFYRPAANRAMLDAEMVTLVVQTSPEPYRKVFARALLIHPHPGVRAAARQEVEPADCWYLIANRWTSLELLLEVWQDLRERANEDFFKIFLFCVYDRFLGGGKEQHQLALKFFRALLEVKVFHERIYFQLILKIEKSLRSSAKLLGLDLDYDEEYQRQMRTFANHPIAPDQPVQSWGHVPLPVQRMLARRGLFLRFFSCHPIDPIALECLKHLARREEILEYLKLFAINTRLLGQLAEERRLFESDAAKFHLVANPRCPFHIIARYLGYLTSESLLKLFQGREYNTFSRQQAERLLEQRGKTKKPR